MLRRGGSVTVLHVGSESASLFFLSQVGMERERARRGTFELVVGNKLKFHPSSEFEHHTHVMQCAPKRKYLQV